MKFYKQNQLTFSISWILALCADSKEPTTFCCSGVASDDRLTNRRKFYTIWGVFISKIGGKFQLDLEALCSGISYEKKILFSFSLLLFIIIFVIEYYIQRFFYFYVEY